MRKNGKYILITAIAIAAAAVIISLVLKSCSSARSLRGIAQPEDIVIIFDGDTHGEINGYPKIAALKKQMLEQTPHVIMISTGDFLQGSQLCARSEGGAIVPLVNSAGYDLIAPGSHDFDYGFDRFAELADSLNALVISSNIRRAEDGRPVFVPYVIHRYGQTNVGFLGVINPVTQGLNAPQSYYDEDGRLKYTFTQEQFYKMVQQLVDEVRRRGADYVVLLSHMGNSNGTHETADGIIRATNGINVVIDSHDHKVTPEAMVPNKDGTLVLRTSSGARFQYMGVLTICANGKIVSRMVATDYYDHKDEATDAIAQEYTRQIEDSPNAGYTNFVLQGYDKPLGHYDRNVQTNLGSLYADALRAVMGAEIGWINAGAISTSIDKGAIKQSDLLEMCPYGNQACLGEVTGQQILDALEYGNSRYPRDFSNYPVLSGLLYSVDTTIVSSVRINQKGFMSGLDDNQRRVSHVTVYNRTSKRYEPLDPARKYRIASVDYLLKNHGSGNIFDGCEIIEGQSMLDIQLLETYLKHFKDGVVSESYNFKK